MFIVKREKFTNMSEIMEIEIIKNNEYLNNIDDEIFKLDMEKFIKLDKLTKTEEYLSLKLQKDKIKMEKSAKNRFNLILKQLRLDKEKLLRIKENNQILLKRYSRNKIEF